MTSAAQAELQTALAPGSLICLDTNCLLYYFKDIEPWASSLDPIFQAKDDGRVKLVTSSITLTELLARTSDVTEETEFLSSVRQYFDFLPVNEDVGIRAAGIRRDSRKKKGFDDCATCGTRKDFRKGVTTPDAVEMATATETRSLLFITNDEQLTRMPQTVKALYLKDLALDWLEDEFAACQASEVTAAIPNRPPQRLDLTFWRDPSGDWMVLENGLVMDDFVHTAMMLTALVKGPCAVIGQAQGQGGTEQVHALRVLPAGRPWITPAAPDWMRHFTNKKCEWHEPAPRKFIQDIQATVVMKDEERRKATDGERAMPFIVVNTSRLDAVMEVNALDGNNQMPEHKKRQEIWRRYLAPFKPVMSLLELPGARLWKVEAQNAHELDVDRFRRFFTCAENVIGKEAGQ